MIRSFALLNGQNLIGEFGDITGSMTKVEDPCIFMVQSIPGGQMGLAIMDAIPMAEDNTIDFYLDKVLFEFKPGKQLLAKYENMVEQIKAAKAGIELVKGPRLVK